MKINDNTPTSNLYKAVIEDKNFQWEDERGAAGIILDIFINSMSPIEEAAEEVKAWASFYINHERYDFFGVKNAEEIDWVALTSQILEDELKAVAGLQ